MDVQPATSHEIVQAENQSAIDALRQLIATRDAFVRMCDARPSLTEPNAPAARQLLDALAAFWASSETTGGDTRVTMLGRHLASVMKEEATLRGLDGTLGTDAASLAARAAALKGGSMAPGLHPRELMLGDVPHAGSLIVVDDAKPALALLFTVHGGWEAFDSLERLLQSTRRRMLESVDATDGSGLEDDAFAEAKTQGTVGSREISGDVFATLASRMVDVQASRIAHAVDDYALDIAEPDAAIRLGDRIGYELSSTSMLDIDAIEHLREAYLLEASVAERLRDVPASARDAWYDARDTYNDTLTTAAMLRAAFGVQPALTLHAFASRELAAKLATLGVDTSPEAITVEIGRIKVLPEPLDLLDPLPGSTAVRRVSLIDLAAQNTGRFSLETLHAVDAEGASLRDRLSQGAIRDMVRDLDLARRYQNHLDERLRQGPVGALARKLAMAVHAAQMRLEAAEARLSYHLPGDPRSFIDDRDERGFRWVDAALDAPAGTRHVDKHEVVVSQVTYQQAPLEGVLIFASRTAGSAPRVVVYTPGAPDGRPFREFESRQQAAKEFFYHPAFREYLLDRLPAEFATVSPNGATRQFAGDRLAHWVLGSRGDAAYTLTAEPFGEREVRGDFLATSYDTMVEKYRRDARLLTRSTADADKDAWLSYLQGRFNAAPATVVATMLAEVPASLGRMVQASWRFYDHVKAGDTGEAFIAFTEGYVNALNLAVPPFVGGRHIAGALVRSRSATRGVASTNIRRSPPRARFDDRYAVRTLRKAGKPDDEGIFRVRGQSYIDHEGTFFLVRRDNDYGLWRLSPPQGAMDARFTGPLLERIDGRWVYAHDVGLRGGMRRIRERLGRLVVRDEPELLAVAAVEDAAPVAQAAPPAPPPLVLPHVMEPFRPEITAALTDNPSALARIRDDGTHLQIVVRPRSALLVDPNLHADIGALSAHQRRVFLHELDARFPLHAERAEVLGIRGWAQADGRRVPSRPPSPGSTTVADLQSPSISSSTGDPTPPRPTLTPGQQGRWDEALTLARNAPRSSRRPSIDSASDVAETLPLGELVPHDEWPRQVWYFSKHRFHTEFVPGLHREVVTLGGDTALMDATSGLRTYPVSVLPPETPLNRLAEALGTSPIQQAGRRDPLGYAMLIDMARLRDATTAGQAVMGGPGFELRRRILPNGEYQYTLQSSRRVRIATSYIISVSRRGGQPTPLPGIRF
ncbi:MAG TPA: DUF6543 domain-containing protein [Luteibacter sp.]|uniref:dermonecrotic toxin domain-containing protein n=1 Tax=Luteibacter sp. TaxID=1886636 RepID=UPI002B928C53|nr:DUF6543 domain-containing protein [Luteibacter sp.]HVI56532.1 DUF6543 domain-containing protein [Luteibacter sp.]